jgi:exodeoxyribonuclease VII small subunit
MSKKTPTYREAAAEIESILARLDEETDVDIDELAARVERAAELIQFCSEKLRAAELRVEKVTRELAGTAAEEGPAGSPASPAAGD